MSDNGEEDREYDDMVTEVVQVLEVVAMYM